MTDNTPAGRLTIGATARFSGIEAGILLGGEAAPLTVMRMLVRKGRARRCISHMRRISCFVLCTARCCL